MDQLDHHLTSRGRRPPIFPPRTHVPYRLVRADRTRIRHTHTDQAKSFAILTRRFQGGRCMTSLDPFMASPNDRDQVLYTQLPNQDLQLCTRASRIRNRPFVADISCTVKFLARPCMLALGRTVEQLPVLRMLNPSPLFRKEIRMTRDVTRERCIMSALRVRREGGRLPRSVNVNL